MADNAARPSQQPPRSQPPSTEDIDDEWAAEEAPARPLAAAPPPPVAPAPPKLPRESSPEPAEVAPPPALESAVAQTIPVHEAASAGRRGLSLPVLAGLAVAAAVAVWVAFGGGAEDAPQPRAVALAPTPPARVLSPARPAETAPAVPSPASELPTTAATSAPSPGPQQGAASEARVAAPAAGEVLVRLTPEDAKLYRRGKKAGGSGTVLRLQAGERLAFEVVKRGYATRKLVVDGSEREVHVVLRPEPGATP